MKTKKQALYRELQILVEQSAKITSQNCKSTEALEALTSASGNVPVAKSVQQNCVTLVDKLDRFLTLWRRLDDPTGLPMSAIRNILGVIIRNIGTSHQHLRQVILKTLSTQKQMKECRLLFLEVIPLVITSDEDSELVLDRHILPTLDQVLEGDTNLIFPILDCLAAIEKILQSKDGNVKISLQYAMKSLPWIEEGQLTSLIERILEVAETETELKDSLLGIRQEVSLLHDIQENQVLIRSACKSIAELLNHPMKGDKFSKLYFCVLEDALEDDRDATADGEQYLSAGVAMESQDKPSTLDLFVMSKLCQHPIHGGPTLSMIQFLGENMRFPFKIFKALIHTTLSKECPDTIFVKTVISWCLILVQSTHRKHTRRTKEFRDQLKLAVVDLHAQLDTADRGLLVATLYRFYKSPSHPTAHMGEATIGAATNITITAPSIVPSTPPASQRSFLLDLLKELVDLDDSGQMIFIAQDVMKSLEEDPDASHVAKICSFVVSILERNNNAEAFRGTVMRSVQNLLLGFKPQMTQNGLLLCHALIEARVLSADDLKITTRCISELYLHTAQLSLDFSVGSIALRCLKSLQGYARHSDGRSRVFNTIRQGLSSTGLILVQAWYKEQKRKSTVLGFEVLPSYFVKQKDAPSFRPMLFCTATLLKDSLIDNSGDWIRISQWVYDLTNVYLEMGRERTLQATSKSTRGSSWVPTGWLKAPIEFPSAFLECFRTDTGRQKMLLRWLKNTLVTFDLQSPENEMTLNDRELQEILYSVRADVGLPVLVRELKRFCLSLLLSIGVSLAVLSNIFAHFKDKLSIQGGASDGDSGSSITNSKSLAPDKDALHQVGYVLAKVFNLKAKCILVRQVFKSIMKILEKPPKRPAKRRKNNRNGYVQSQLEASESIVGQLSATCSKIDRTLQHYFSSSSFIKRELLLICATDFSGYHQSDPQSYLDGHESDDHQWVLRLHMDCLQQLIIWLESDRHSTGLGEMSIPIGDKPAAWTDLPLSYFGTCIRNTAQMLKVIDGQKCGAKNLVDLCTLHIQLLSFCLVRAHETSRSPQSPQPPQLDAPATNDENREADEVPNAKCSSGDTYIQLLELLSASLSAKQTCAADDSSSTIADRRDIAECTAANALLLQVSQSNSSRVVFQLLEVLSVICDNSNRDMAPSLLDASWVVLNTRQEAKHAGQNDIASTPTALTKAAKMLVEIPPAAEVSQTRSAQLAATKIYARLAQSLSERCDNHSYFIDNMRRHWGICALNAHRHPENMLGFLLACTEKLEKYLQQLNPYVERRHLGEISDNDDEEYKPQRASRTEILRDVQSDIPDLSASSLPFFYEVLVHTTIASLTLIKPSISQNDGGNGEAPTPAQNPFRNIASCLEIFGRLVDVFNKKHFVFPRAIPRVVSGAAKTILTVAMHVLHECIDWRSHQPSLSLIQKQNGLVDVASIDFLEQLFATVDEHVTKKLEAFCSLQGGSISKGKASKFNPKRSSAGQESKASDVLLRAVYAFEHRMLEILPSSNPGQALWEFHGYQSTLQSMPKPTLKSLQDIQFFPTGELKRDNNLSRQDLDGKKNCKRIASNRRECNTIEGNDADSVGSGASENSYSFHDSDSDTSECFAVSGDWIAIDEE